MLSATDSPGQDKQIDEILNRNLRRSLYVIPLHVCVPIAIWLLFAWAGHPMDWKAFGIGALGWIIALVLRAPIAASVIRLPKKKGGLIVAGSSGPLEEGVRLAALALTSTAFGWSLSLGQGWAAVEVLFTIANVIALAGLGKRTDEKAMQAKEVLKATGGAISSPLWGVAERVSASAFHIGCTLLVAANPWLVIALIPIHSFTNLSMVAVAKKSIKLAEALIFLIGAAAFIAGLLLLTKF